MPESEPLAAKAGDRLACASKPNDCGNTGEKIALRLFMEKARNNDQLSGGSAPMAARGVKKFADTLYRFLSEANLTGWVFEHGLL